MKEIGRFGIQDVDKNPSLPKGVNHVMDPTNLSISAFQTQSHSQDTALQPLAPIKIQTENQGMHMSEEVFESLSSPKKGKEKSWGNWNTENNGNSKACESINYSQ